MTDSDWQWLTVTDTVTDNETKTGSRWGAGETKKLDETKKTKKKQCFFGFITGPAMPGETKKNTDFLYKEILWNLEPRIYQNLKPFKNREKEKILISGNVESLIEITHSPSSS